MDGVKRQGNRGTHQTRTPLPNILKALIHYAQMEIIGRLFTRSLIYWMDFLIYVLVTKMI